MTAFSRKNLLLGDLLAGLGGGLTVLAFAPYRLFPMAIVGPVFFWLAIDWAPTWKRRVWRGYVYGLALFGFGVNWIDHSLHLFGGGIAPVAGLLTAIFVAALALVYAGLAAVASFFQSLPKSLRYLLIWPALWVSFEWLRSWLFTGFPWLLLGDSQVHSAAAGIAPVFGVFGVSAFLLFLSGLVLLALQERGWQRWSALLLVFVTWFGVGQMRKISWTTPAGKWLRVSLVQGDVMQNRKFDLSTLDQTLRRYYRQTTRHWNSRLIVWPETAVPILYRDAAPEFLQPLARQAATHHTSLLIGIFRRRAGKIYNAVVSYEGHAHQFYEKHHLVPFGEYLPMRQWLGWLYGDLKVPMANLAAGHQGYILHAAGIPVGMTICYEIAYADLVRKALPKARLLVNVSDDAWFGDSLEPEQQLQMAQMRALQSGRFLLVGTNSGISAIISPHGRLLTKGPWNRVLTITGMVRPMKGATPWVRWGNAPTLWLIFLILLFSGGWIAIIAMKSKES